MTDAELLRILWYHRAILFSTPLGGIFSIMTVLLIAGLAALLSAQNTALPTLTSSIITTGIPFEPVGTHICRIPPQLLVEV
jgi:hypothetical protein